jgi:hypothetical protein
MAVEKVIELKIKGSDDIAKIKQETQALNAEIGKIKGESKKANDSLAGDFIKSKKFVEVVDQQTGGLASSFLKLSKAAKIGGAAMKTALISSGIGAAVVLVGFIVEHWEAITDLVDSTNKNLQNQIDLSKKLIDNYDDELSLLKQQEKIIELQNGSTEEIRQKQIDILRLQAEQNVLLLENLKTQLEKEKAQNRELTFWETLKIAASGLLSEEAKMQAILAAVSDESERSLEIENALFEAKKKSFEIEDNILQIEKKTTDEGKKRAEKGKIFTEKEIKRLDLIEKIRLKFLSKRENLENKTAQEKLDLEKIRAEESLKALVGTEKEKRKALEQINAFFDKKQQEVDKAKELELLRINKLEFYLSLDAKKFNAERIKDDLLRLQELKKIKEEESKFELQRLQNEINKYEEGTQARVDAEIEFNTQKQELAQQAQTIDDNISQITFDRQRENAETFFNNEQESFALRLEALRNFNQMVLDSDQLTEIEKQKLLQETADKEKILQQQRLNLAGQTAGNIANMLGAQSKTGKAFAVAQALINTYQGVSAELATKTATPFEFGLKLANIATTLALGFKSVKDILAVKTPAGGGGGSVPSGGGGISQPSFNVVGTSGVNQIADTLNQEQQPIQAFVVGSNVTTQQALDRNIVDTATIG